MISDVPKSIEEGSEEDVSTEEQNEQSQSKRSYMGENPLNDEFTMPVMQNSASRDVDEVMNELARLSNNNKRYYGKWRRSFECLFNFRDEVVKQFAILHW